MKWLWTDFRDIRPNDVPKHFLAENGEAIVLGQGVGVEIESAGCNTIHDAFVAIADAGVHMQTK